MIRIFLIWLFFIYPASQSAGSQPTLTIQVRQDDGSPVVGEEIVLMSQPDDEAVDPPCVSDGHGRCRWQVRRGLYEVKFNSYDLDELSALAVAEGGLNYLSLTVGERDITYHFTFQADGHVYFDAASDSAVPQPIIPTLSEADIIVGAVKAVPATAMSPTAVSPSPTLIPKLIQPSVSGVGVTADTSPVRRSVFILLLAGGGGLGVYGWQKKKKKG